VDVYVAAATFLSKKYGHDRPKDELGPGIPPKNSPKILDFDHFDGKIAT
jgi:hypothetical protein